jgi:hypothetical protein
MLVLHKFVPLLFINLIHYYIDYVVMNIVITVISQKIHSTLGSFFLYLNFDYKLLLPPCVFVTIGLLSLL